jgi:hypothetical protein
MAGQDNPYEAPEAREIDAELPVASAPGGPLVTTGKEAKTNEEQP